MFNMSTCLKWIVCFVIVCCFNGLYAADSIPEEMFDVLVDRDVIIDSEHGSTLKATILKNKESQIIVADEQGEILFLEKNTVKHIRLDKQVFRSMGVSKVDTKPSGPYEHHVTTLSPLEYKKDMMQSGQSMKSLGNIFFVPGLTVSLFGAASFGVANAKSANRGDGSRVVKDWRAAGWASLGIGIPVLATGVILRALGNNKIQYAKKLKGKEQNVSYRMDPIVDPLTDTYGVSLNFTF